MPVLIQHAGTKCKTDCKTFCRTPVQRPKNIKKLKAFFGERTPKIIEAQTQALSGDAPLSPLADISLEGALTYKPEQVDNKVP